MPLDHSPHPSVQLLRMITAPWLSQAIYVAAKLGIADTLDAGPRSVEQLAAANSVNRDALYRVLRALASVGIFSEEREGVFSLTPLAEPLRSDVPGSMRAMAILNGEERFRTFGEVLESVRTGAPVFEKVMGKKPAEYIADHEEDDAIRLEASTTFAHQLDGFVAQTYDFSDVDRLVAFGGGRGTLLASILRRYPKMNATLIVPASGVEAARTLLEQQGVIDRCEIVGGDVRETVPPPSPVYLLANSLHGWNDEDAMHILQHIRRSTPQDGRLLAVEMVLPEGDEPHFGKLFDLFLLVARGGRERTRREFEELFSRGGFQVEQVVPTPGPVSVIEAVPQFREKRRAGPV
jgi:hypothetical protein